ncbi:MAG: rhodanese-like domain-containing protein [Phycisphaerae bacterium]|nr:rhodanese-like domain-containing protein [Phycisphaerae bacterium]MDW8261727.1 rhodanese-like domain-containing protein [Phycisphaerales bacterium]
MELKTITPDALAEKVRLGEPVDLIDVRTPLEFREVHCPFARNLPLSELDPQQVMRLRRGAADQPVYFICRSGSRAKQACERLIAAGFTNVVNVTGGMLAWVEQGLPVNRGKKAISLERQVRIAAGSMVLIGAILGYFVHPLWIGLCAFVGAGLVFAGITDTCGMAMLLARMPWNQVRVPAAGGDESSAGATEAGSCASSPAGGCH